MITLENMMIFNMRPTCQIHASEKTSRIHIHISFPYRSSKHPLPITHTFDNQLKYCAVQNTHVTDIAIPHIIKLRRYI